MSLKKLLFLFLLSTFFLLTGIIFTCWPIQISKAFGQISIFEALTEERISFLGILLILAWLTTNIYLYLQGASPITALIESLFNWTSNFIQTPLLNHFKSAPNQASKRRTTINVFFNRTVRKATNADKTVHRLIMEIEMTRRNSNINLIIGILTTGVAVYILGDTLIAVSATDSLKPNYYIPRVALSFLVELFSFFFLRLYRKNLDDIKYLTNEYTNVEAKKEAANLVRNTADLSLQKIVIEGLMNTERNFILKKGESTVDLEKIKFERNDSLNIIEKMFAIFTKNNKR